MSRPSLREETALYVTFLLTTTFAYVFGVSLLPDLAAVYYFLLVAGAGMLVILNVHGPS